MSTIPDRYLCEPCDDAALEAAASGRSIADHPHACALETPGLCACARCREQGRLDDLAREAVRNAEWHRLGLDVRCGGALARSVWW